MMESSAVQMLYAISPDVLHWKLKALREDVTMWVDEARKCRSGPLFNLPTLDENDATASGETIHQQFLRQWSVTFCPRCGLRRFNGQMTLDPYPTVAQICRGCDLDPYEMTQPLDATAPAAYRKNKAYYITPGEEQLPRYDAAADRFLQPCKDTVPDNYADMSSMLDLTREEALSLCIVNVYVDTSVHAGKTGSCQTVWMPISMTNGR